MSWLSVSSGLDCIACICSAPPVHLCLQPDACKPGPAARLQATGCCCGRRHRYNGPGELTVAPSPVRSTAAGPRRRSSAIQHDKVGICGGGHVHQTQAAPEVRLQAPEGAVEGCVHRLALAVHRALQRAKRELVCRRGGLKPAASTAVPACAGHTPGHLGSAAAITLKLTPRLSPAAQSKHISCIACTRATALTTNDTPRRPQGGTQHSAPPAPPPPE